MTSNICAKWSEWKVNPIRKRDKPGTLSVMEREIPIGHFDEARREEGFLCGVWTIIKVDHLQSFQISWNCGKCTNTRGELLALWDLLWTTKMFHISHLQIRGDSKIVVD